MFRSSQALACRDCGADALRLVDGVFVCGECGTQSQDVLDEQTEWTAGINTTQRGGVRTRRGIARVKPPPAPPVAPRAAALAYADCLQRMLAAQTEALVAAGDAPEALGSVARRIWAAYVAVSGVFEVTATQRSAKRRRGADRADEESEEESEEEEDDDPSLRPRGRAGRGTAPPVLAGSQRLQSLAEGPEGEDDEDDDDDEDGDGQRPAARKTERRLTTQLHNRLPLLTPLAVLCLGCHWLRCALPPRELCARAADGRLPYLGFHALLPADVAKDAPPGALAPPAPPGPRRLAAAMAAVAAALRMQLPPANGPALAARLAARLALPAAAGRAAGRMLLLHEPEELRVLPTASEAAWRAGAAEAAVAASLLFVLKAVYGLGAAPAGSGWARWAAALAEGRAEAARRADALRGAAAAGAALLASAEERALPWYDAFLRQHVFAGAQPPRAAAAAASRLRQLAEPALAPGEQQPRYRPPAPPPWTPVPLAEPLPHAIWRDIAAGGDDYGAVLAQFAAEVEQPPAALHRALVRLEERAFAAEAAAAAELAQQVRDGRATPSASAPWDEDDVD